jgi:hypothetical protein
MASFDLPSRAGLSNDDAQPQALSPLFVMRKLTMQLLIDQCGFHLA